MSEKDGDEDHHKAAKEFLAKLMEFHQKNGTPLRRIPTLGGRELDVYHLYKKVESLGGHELVSQARLWGEVARSFHLPASVTSASYAVRQHYIKLLEKFEAYEKDPNYFNYVQPVTFTPKPLPPPLPWRNMVAMPIPKTTLPYIPVAKDQGVGFDRLARSLLSGYPNEVDFVFNVLTVLTFKASGDLSSSEFPRVVDLMLAHVAVFPSCQLHDDLQLETLYHECWYPPDSDTDFLKFWAMTSPEWVCAALFPDYCPISLHQHSGMFASRRDDTVYVVETYRISQVATIFSNLVLSLKFMPFLSKHDGTLRFLLLATSCSHPTIKSTAMDVLIHMVPHLLILSPSSSLSSSPPWETTCLLELLVRSMLECMFAQDRDSILQSLEVLSQLSWEPPNQTLLTLMHVEVWQRVFQLLLLSDVQLVLLCLDLLYSVTLYDSIAPPSAASTIVSLCRWCEVLMSLLTLDIKSFGEEALSKVLVMDATTSTTSSTTLYSSPATSLKTLLPKTTLPMPTTTPPSKRKVFLNVAKSDKLIPNTGSKPVNSQTIRIGNMVIPVMSMTNLLTQGRTAVSSLSQGLSSLTAGRMSSSAQGQNPINSTALIQGLASLSSSPMKVSSSLTIQLLQSLLSLSQPSNATPVVAPSTRTLGSESLGHPPITTPIVASSKGALGNESLSHAQNTPSKGELGGESSVPINHSGTGGSSGVMIRKVQVVPVGESNCQDKPFSNLLRTYLAKNASTTSPASSQAVPLISSNATSSQSKNSNGSTPSPTLSSLTSSSSASSMPSLLESFATQWLEANYQECRGSYVSQLEMYSLYLMVCHKAGFNTTLSNADFYVLLRKVFVNSLSTRIAVGNQSVNMMAGLTKKLSPSTASSSAEPRRDSLTIITPITHPTTPHTHIQTSTSSSNLASSTGRQISQSSAMTTLARVGYSTMSPLVVSSKAVRAETENCLTGCGGDDVNKNSSCVEIRADDGDCVSGNSEGDIAVVNGVDDQEDGKMDNDEEMDDGVHLAKRIKLMHSEIITVTSVWSTTTNSVQVTNSFSMPSQPSANAITPSIPTIKVSTYTNNISHPSSTLISTVTSQPITAALTTHTLPSTSSASPAEAASNRNNLISSPSPPSSVGGGRNVGMASNGSQLLNVKQNSPDKKNHLLPVSSSQPSPLTTPSLRTPTFHTPTPSLSTPTSPVPAFLSLPSLTTAKLASLLTPTPSPVLSLSSSSNTAVSLERGSCSDKSSPSPTPSDLSSCTAGSVPVVVNAADVKCCLWDKCNSMHSDWSSLMAHLNGIHLRFSSFPASCCWEGCQNHTRRQRFSLLSHLQVCHCTDDHTHSPPNIQKTLARLKTLPPLEVEAEDTLTKAVRLTAALVLRNLAQQLPEARRRLKSYEHILCQVALSDSEASTATLHCLQILSPDRY